MYDFERELLEILQESLKHAKLTQNLRLAGRIENYLAEGGELDE